MCRGLVSIRVCKASVTVFPATDANAPVCGELRNSAGWREEGHDIKKWMHISKAFQGRQRGLLCARQISTASFSRPLFTFLPLALRLCCPAVPASLPSSLPGSDDLCYCSQLTPFAVLAIMCRSREKYQGLPRWLRLERICLQ